MSKDTNRLREICEKSQKKSKIVPFKELTDLCEYNALELMEKFFDKPISDEEIGKERANLLTNSLYVKKQSVEGIKAEADTKWLELYFKALLSETPFLLESYIEYLEHNRPNEKKFYQPRQRLLHPVAMDLQWLEDDPKAKFYGLSMPPRVGKALAFSTPILTDKGWKLHGNLEVGDRVIGADGEFKKVIAVHPPCKMEYRVKFADGEQIDCHGNHEWIVKDRRYKEEQIYETSYMLDKINEKDGHKRFSVANKEIIQGEYNNLAIHPYLLGVWLGDGRNTNPDICEPKEDRCIIEHIQELGYEVSWSTVHKTTGVEYYGIKGLREHLQNFEMCHSRHTMPKYIPDEYLTASIEQRLQLLAGLLDTDGSLRKSEHRYCFSTTEPRLRDDFVSLVNSFGWRTCVVSYEPKLSSSGIQGRKEVYAISFNPTMYIPCQVERKQLNEYSKQRNIAIESIERLDTPTIGNCITVEGGVYLAGRTLKPTHNSTIAIQFLTWLMCKRPNSHSAMGGHSGILAKGFYKEVLNFISTEEYAFADMYNYMHPDSKVMIRDKSADEFTITLDKPDRFATLTCRGIDGTWTGAVDVSNGGLLYVDDLVRDREHSLSAIRMENTYQEYLNKMVDRCNMGSKQLMIGTLWNVYDPLERLRQQYEGQEGYRFTRIPALNDNDESNFQYTINGFSTEYYREMREKLNDAEWQAKYQQRPYVREGLLFQSDDLRYFNGILPDGDHRIVAVVDVAWGGGDSLSMPIGAEYDNGDVYIFAWVFNKGTKEVTLPLVTGSIIANDIRQIRFEGNTGGDLYSQYVDEKLREQKYKCSCSSRKAPSTMAKKEKIIAYSDDIKRKFIFLTDQRPTQAEKEQDALTGVVRYIRNDEYQSAMDELCTYSTLGKNEHDDAPDGLTQLEMFIEGDGVATVEAVVNPFCRG